MDDQNIMFGYNLLMERSKIEKYQSIFLMNVQKQL